MAKPSPLPKYQPQKHVAFVLTTRDLDILRALNRYRYLRTGQVQRLCFPNCRSIQSARRRLKYLFHNRYVGRITPYIQIGQGSCEVAYYLEKEGRKLLESQGETLSTFSSKHQVRPIFLQHALDVSEFRLCTEQALTHHPTIALRRFVADFELRHHTKNAVGKHRYRLYDEIQHPTSRQNYTVYPDAMFILQGKDALAEHQRLYFVEIDRGTEALKVIRDKLIGYNLYHQHGTYQKFGRFNGFRLLFQTKSQKRLDNLMTLLDGFEGADLVWFTSYDTVTPQSLLSQPIWTDRKRQSQTILKT